MLLAAVMIDMCPSVRVDSIDSETLLHRKALVPDVHVVRRQFGRPLRRQLIYAGKCNTIDEVVEHSPRIPAVCGIEALPRCRSLQGGLSGSLEVLEERELCRDVCVGARARDVPAHQRVEIPLTDLLHLFEVRRNVLCDCKSTPGHPT